MNSSFLKGCFPVQMSLLPSSKVLSFLPFSFDKGAQYTVYAYNQYEDQMVGHNHWQRILTSDNAKQAILRAESLYETHRYQKIEIKKKVFDSQIGTHIDSVYKTYNEKQGRNMYTVGMMALAIVSCCALYLSN